MKTFAFKPRDTLKRGLILTLEIPLLRSPGSSRLWLWERPEARGRKWGSGSGNGRGRSGPVGGGGAWVAEGKDQNPAAGRSPQVGAASVGVGRDGAWRALEGCYPAAHPVLLSCSGQRQAGGRRGPQVCVRVGHYCVTPSRHSLLLEASPRPSLAVNLLAVNSLRAVAGLSRLCDPVPSTGPAWSTVVVLKRLWNEWSECRGATLATGSWFSVCPSR